VISLIPGKNTSTALFSSFPLLPPLPPPLALLLLLLLARPMRLMFWWCVFTPGAGSPPLCKALPLVKLVSHLLTSPAAVFAFKRPIHSTT